MYSSVTRHGGEDAGGFVGLMVVLAESRLEVQQRGDLTYT